MYLLRCFLSLDFYWIVVDLLACLVTWYWLACYVWWLRLIVRGFGCLVCLLWVLICFIWVLFFRVDFGFSVFGWLVLNVCLIVIVCYDLSRLFILGLWCAVLWLICFGWLGIWVTWWLFWVCFNSVVGIAVIIVARCLCGGVFVLIVVVCFWLFCVWLLFG